MKSLRSMASVALILALPLSVPARELPQAPPAEAGFSAERLERIGHVVQAAIDAEQVAGAVTLVQRRGQVVQWQAYGDANVETGRDMQADDVFRIASMSKAVTSTAVMMLFEEGHFLLDDPIGDYLPAFDRPMQVARKTDGGYEFLDAEKAITIRHLLTHTSGLSYRFMNVPPLAERYIAAGISDGFAGETILLENFVPQLAQMPLAHEPGEAWSYGLNIDVLGRLVEVVSGQALDAFMQERIFAPLDMKDTFFELPDAHRSRMPAVHRVGARGQLEVVPDGRIDDGPVRYSVNYPYDGHRGFLSGGAGLSSTARDYGRFLQMILNGGTLDGTRLLGRKTVELMMADQTQHLDDPVFGAGGHTLAFGLSTEPGSEGRMGSPGMLGWSGFFNTNMWIDPQEQLVAVFLTQHYPFGIEVMEKFRVAVYQAIVD